MPTIAAKYVSLYGMGRGNRKELTAVSNIYGKEVFGVRRLDKLVSNLNYISAL